jgi:hypothetical protein
VVECHYSFLYFPHLAIFDYAARTAIRANYFATKNRLFSFFSSWPIGPQNGSNVPVQKYNIKYKTHKKLHKHIRVIVPQKQT